MAYRYASIDEGYCVTGLKNLDAVVKECGGMFLDNGDCVTTIKQAKDLLAKNDLRLYQYDQDELEEVRNGVPVRKDWTTKIVKL